MISFRQDVKTNTSWFNKYTYTAQGSGTTKDPVLLCVNSGLLVKVAFNTPQ